jgi:hypothetical protein
MQPSTYDLAPSMERLLKNSKRYDIALRSIDGTNIPAHKVCPPL